MLAATQAAFWQRTILQNLGPHSATNTGGKLAAGAAGTRIRQASATSSGIVRVTASRKASAQLALVVGTYNPQRGFSRAICFISARTSSGTGGRPGASG